MVEYKLSEYPFPKNPQHRKANPAPLIFVLCFCFAVLLTAILIIGYTKPAQKGSQAETVLSLAESQLGYREKADDSRLEELTANAGDANYTKYARDLAQAGYYNGDKNGYEWCDVFVDWCFWTLYGSEAGQEMECQTGELGAGCVYSAEYYEDAGRFDDNPRPGDQVFFLGDDGEISHTGLVERVGRFFITTIEGNKSERVKRCVYWKSSLEIAGYGHPRYESR